MIKIDPLIKLDPLKQYYGSYDPITDTHEYHEITKPDEFVTSQTIINDDGTMNIMGSDSGNNGLWSGQIRVFQDVNTGGFQLYANWNVDLYPISNIVISQYDNSFYVDGSGNPSGNLLDTDSPNPNYLHFFSKVYPAPNQNQNYYFFIRINYSGGGYAWSYYYNSSSCTLTTPTLTYNSTNNTVSYSNVSDVKIIEYRRVTDNNIYNKSWLARKLFYSSAFDNTENYELYRSSFTNLRKWDEGNYTISVRRLASVSQDYYELSLYYIAQWAYDFNSVVPTISFDIVTDSSEGDINVTIGNYMELFGYIPSDYDFRYGGTFEISTDTNNRIYHAEVKISTGTDARYETFTTHKRIIYEELTQPMGVINDTTEHIGYIPCEYGYPEKDNEITSGVNREILELLYNSGFPTNTTNATIATAINAPYGGKQITYSGAALDFLTPGIQHEIRLFTYSNSGNFALPTDWQTITVPSNLAPTKPSAPTIQQRVNGGLILSWLDVGATSYHFAYGLVGGGKQIIYNVPSNTYNLSNLNYGTTYAFIVLSNNAYGSSGWSSESIGTTAPKIPTISSSGGSGGNVNINISGMAGNWTYVKVWYKELSSPNWLNIQVNYPNTIASLSGLTIGSTYQIKASSFYHVNNVDLESRDNNGNIGYSNELNVTISDRPENFTFGGIYSGATITFDNATKTIYIVSASSWNSFLDRINQFRIYKGLEANSYTPVNSGDDFTKHKFNIARLMMSDLSIHFTGGNSLLPARQTGDHILNSAIFLNLTNCLNSIA